MPTMLEVKDHNNEAFTHPLRCLIIDQMSVKMDNNYDCLLFNM